MSKVIFKRCVSLLCVLAVALSAFIFVISVQGENLAVVAASGEGNLLINGSFEADNADSANLPTGWVFKDKTDITYTLSDTAQVGEQSLCITAQKDNAKFSLYPEKASETGKISGLKTGIYTLSFYIKGNSAVSLRYISEGVNNSERVYNEDAAELQDWLYCKQTFAVGNDGILEFSICSTQEGMNKGSKLFIDNIILSMNTALFNGDFEGADNIPSVNTNIVVNSGFEDGYVTDKQLGGFTNVGDETVNIFCAENGSELASGYYFKTFTSQGNKVAINTDSNYVYNGNRSLKVSNIVKDGLNNRVHIVPENATKTKKMNNKTVLFTSDLTEEAYKVKVYVKIATESNTAPVEIIAYDWDSATEKVVSSTTSVTPDSNGWYCLEANINTSSGYLGFSVSCSYGNQKAMDFYLDNLTVTESKSTKKSDVQNGGFENGTVTDKQVGGYTNVGDETPNIFCANNGNELTYGYYFKTFTSQGNKVAINTDSNYVYSGNRSLKVSNIVKDGLNNRFHIVPENATETKKIDNKTVLFTSGLTKSAYKVKVYVKISTENNTAPVEMVAYDWDSKTFKVVSSTASVTPDSNGWYCLEANINTSSGYLGVSISCSYGNQKAMDVYLDDFSITESEPIKVDYITNGGFENGTVTDKQVGGFTNVGDETLNIFCAENGSELASGYYFKTFTSQGNKAEINTNSSYVYEGSRSLKFSNILDSSLNNRIHLVPESASVTKKIDSKTVLFTPGFASGTYVIECYVKIATENNTAPVQIVTYNWAAGTKTVAASTNSTVADANGWYNLKAEITVATDGYLGFSISCEYGNSRAMSFYLDKLSVVDKTEEPDEEDDEPIFYETDIPYWKSDIATANSNILSLTEDTFTGDKALKVTLNGVESSSITPSFSEYMIKSGYSMLVFSAKGKATLTVTIVTDSGELKKEFELGQNWKKYLIKDIEVKKDETIKRILFTFEDEGKDSENYLDSVQLYSQVGPAKITENFEIISGDRSICLPCVADGYSVAVKSISDENIIAKNGKITKPQYNTVVDIVLSVTNINDKTDTADSHKISVMVLGTNGEKPEESAKIQTRVDTETNVSVTASMLNATKFKAFALSEDNKYFNFLYIDEKDVAGFFRAVLTPKDSYKGELEFKFPVDSSYNGKTVTVVYRLESEATGSVEAVVKNGFISVKANETGHFLILSEKPVVDNNKPQETPVIPDENQPNDTPDDDQNGQGGDNTQDNKPDDSLEESQPVHRVMVDYTLVYSIIIVSVSLILMIIEITATIIATKKARK